VRLLWKVLREFSSADKVRFLKWVTNCSRPPVFGFRNLKPGFCVQKLDEQGSDRLPIAAVCFNTLKLPDYRNEAILRSKLQLAINSGMGYYII